MSLYQVAIETYDRLWWRAGQNRRRETGLSSVLYDASGSDEQVSLLLALRMDRAPDYVHLAS
ncbi:uncharacterized protein PG986_013002 [Apiospora aurea]|uniref:Uncharacterized protein n=1 Tax=Apiospora aurea TaxID=335848 RepID=A0ABR1Q1L4_9PEZI